MSGVGLLTALVLTPAIGLAVLLAIPGRFPKAIKVVSALTGFVTLALMAVIYARFDAAASGCAGVSMAVIVSAGTLGAGVWLEVCAMMGCASR